MARLEQEVRLLAELRPRTTGRLPEVRSAELELPIGEAYVEHTLISGRVLDAGCVRALSRESFRAVALATGRFLSDLHAQTDVAGHAGVGRLTLAGFADALQAEVDTLLAAMGPAGRLRAERELAALRALPHRTDALCHTDIGGNIVHDPATGLAGFIDFGSALVTDPVLDVASLSVLGDDFVQAASAAHPPLAERLPDARIVRETFILQDALYGARQQDWGYVDGIIRSYDRPAGRG